MRHPAAPPPFIDRWQFAETPERANTQPFPLKRDYRSAQWMKHSTLEIPAGEARKPTAGRDASPRRPTSNKVDVTVHDTKRNCLLLIEAATSTGPVDAKRRKELKDLFASSNAGPVFVTAFKTRRAMQSFASQIPRESEVRIAEDPDHMVHFNRERFLGPHPDVRPVNK